jgi:hypothetical protein
MSRLGGFLHSLGTSQPDRPVAAATGAFSKFHTMVFKPATEAEAAMKQARDTKSAYKPPNA